MARRGNEGTGDPATHLSPDADSERSEEWRDEGTRERGNGGHTFRRTLTLSEARNGATGDPATHLSADADAERSEEWRDGGMGGSEW